MSPSVKIYPATKPEGGSSQVCSSESGRYNSLESDLNDREIYKHFEMEEKHTKQKLQDSLTVKNTQIMFEEVSRNVDKLVDRWDTNITKDKELKTTDKTRSKSLDQSYHSYDSDNDEIIRLDCWVTSEITNNKTRGKRKTSYSEVIDTTTKNAIPIISNTSQNPRIIKFENNSDEISSALPLWLKNEVLDEVRETNLAKFSSSVVRPSPNDSDSVLKVKMKSLKESRELKSLKERNNAKTKDGHIKPVDTVVVVVKWCTKYICFVKKKSRNYIK